MSNTTVAITESSAEISIVIKSIDAIVLQTKVPTVNTVIEAAHPKETS